MFWPTKVWRDLLRTYGNQKVSGAVGLDNSNIDGVDIVHDLLVVPYPIKDESFEKWVSRVRQDDIFNDPDYLSYFTDDEIIWEKSDDFQ